MQKVLTNAEMREADLYTINTLKTPSEELMFRAGVAIADEAELAAREKKVNCITVVCGTGNNGGDGYVAARELIKRGFEVKIFALEGELSEDCKREKERYEGEYLKDISGSIIIDCIFGTGLSREITGKTADLISKINALKAYVISADIPSGIDGNSGICRGVAVKADKTVAIAEYKTGMFLNDGLDFCGKVVKKDIGITCPKDNYTLINCPRNIAEFYPTRRRNSHKGTYGSVNIIAGSEKYPGAAALSTEAALKSGCGYVKLTSPEKVRYALLPEYPQAVFLENCDFSSDCIAFGMGLTAGDETYNKLKDILNGYGGKLLIDADGLNSLSLFGKDILKDRKCAILLTPHLKEFSRLTGLSVEEILRDPVDISKKFAKEYKVVLLLKSASSIITDGENTVLNVTGTTALSKGGSGDILSGFAAGCMARGLSPFDAAVCASYTLGLSAEISSSDKTDYCATSKDILKNLHFSVKHLTENY